MDALGVAELQAEIERLNKRNKLLDKMNANLEIQMKQLEEYNAKLVEKLTDAQNQLANLHLQRQL